MLRIFSFSFIFLCLHFVLSQNDYTVVHIYPHNKNSFTQGLFFYNGFLYEGTGLKKHSQLLLVDLKSGSIKKSHKLADAYFGEGITLFKDEIIQLTWKSCTAFVYNLKTFKPKRSFTYQSEGWGITSDGIQLIVSDGSNKLSFYSPKDFSLQYTVSVQDWDGSISALNELEYVDGLLYANIYKKNDIISIDPTTGDVIKRYHFKELVENERKKNKNAKELNGIAYNPDKKTFYITGKHWSTLYEVKLNSN